MNLRFIDRALVILLILEVFIATAGTSSADPPELPPPPCPTCAPPGDPPTCDNKCRERRFFKVHDKLGETWQSICVMHKWRECVLCSVPSGKCSSNALDMYPNDTCMKSNKDQQLAKESPTPCNVLCAIPVQNEEAFYTREGAEGPMSYSSIPADGWVDTSTKVYKCTTATGQTYTWDDEKIKD